MVEIQYGGVMICSGIEGWKGEGGRKKKVGKESNHEGNDSKNCICVKQLTILPTIVLLSLKRVH